MNRRTIFAPLALALATLLAACGSGGSDTTARAAVTRLKVAGDSLADVGTFGLKFTIQGADIYPEIVSQQYGLDKGCAFYRFTGTTFAANTACHNYAIGGAVIDGAASGYAAGDPRTIGVQLAAAGAGGYQSGDLLLVDGGGNDAAALVGAYLRAGQPAAAGGDGGASYLALLGRQLGPAQVANAAAGGPAGLAAAGSAYMTALADTFYSQIQAQALDKGATRVAILNMPAVTNTPRFQAVLNGIGASAGAAARAQSETLFKGWIEAYNRQLAARAAGNASVAIVDFYTAFNDQVASPAQFGLTNVTTPACPAVGTGSDGLPLYSFPTCTFGSLAAAPPAGAAGGAEFYKTYAFSDGFHPTPYGHQLLAQLIARTLAQAGWL